MSMIATYLMLLGAILSEVAGTSFLKASNEFSRLTPSVLTVICYGFSFYILSIIVQAMPVGIVYAIWSGMGIVLISLIGWFVFRQALNWQTVVGLGLIIAGVAVVNLFSANIRH